MFTGARLKTNCGIYARTKGMFKGCPLLFNLPNSKPVHQTTPKTETRIMKTSLKKLQKQEVEHSLKQIF